LERPQKRRNKKQETRRRKKIEQETLEGKSLIISFTQSVFPMANENRRILGWETSPPPFHFTQIKKTLKLWNYVFVDEAAQLKLAVLPN